VPEGVLAARSTLGALLDRAAATLTRGSPSDARREAARLWDDLNGLPPGSAWVARRHPVDRVLRARFEAAVRRRASGEPLAYVTGRAAFRTLELAVDSRVLIPRPETEGLVDHVLHWSAARVGGIAADVGTGSGCIALALALEGRFQRIVAMDRSPQAAAVARANTARLSPPVPVDIAIGDWLEPLAGRRCRVIVANPPYLTETEWESLAPDVRCHEPRMALTSGADGLEATRALFAQAPARLESDGLLALEIDERRADTVAELGRAAGWQVTIHEDAFGRPRYALAVQGGGTR
jgi:release factor glutamine methyltransferase